MGESNNEKEFDAATWAYNSGIDLENLATSHSDDAHLLSAQQREDLAKKAKRYETRRNLSHALSFKRVLGKEYTHTNRTLVGATLATVVATAFVVHGVEQVSKDLTPQGPTRADFIVQAALGRPSVLAELLCPDQLERQAEIYKSNNFSNIAGIYITAAVAEKDFLVHHPALRHCPAPNDGTIDGSRDLKETHFDTLTETDVAVTNVDILPGLVEYPHSR